jgi:hypothetical protein
MLASLEERSLLPLRRGWDFRGLELVKPATRLIFPQCAWRLFAGKHFDSRHALPFKQRKIVWRNFH